MKNRMTIFPISLALMLMCAASAYGQDANENILDLTGTALTRFGESPLAGVFVLGNYAYVGGMSTGYNTSTNVGVRIVDLTDPANPVLVSRIPLRGKGFNENHSHGDAIATHISSSAFEGDVAIVLHGVPDSFKRVDFPDPYGLWDVSDPANPTFLSILSFGKGLMKEGGDLGDKPHDSKAAHGGYFYSIHANAATSEQDLKRNNTQVGVADISDPRNPVVIGGWQDDPDVLLFGLSLNDSGTRAYVTGLYPPPYNFESTTIYLYVLNIEDPSQPREIGRYLLPVRSNESSPFIARPTKDGQIVVLTDGGWGGVSSGAPRTGNCGVLHILDTSDVTSISKLSTFWLPESVSPACTGRGSWHIATDVAIRGDIVYSSWLTGGVRAIDISDPTKPIEVGTFSAAPRNISDVALLGSNHLVATAVWDAGLFVLGKTPSSPTTIEDEVETPAGFSLGQNYPNPFSESTTIDFTLEKRENVRITVLDVFGRTVANLADGQHSAGQHSVVWRAGNSSSGTYFYKLETASRLETKSLLIAR